MSSLPAAQKDHSFFNSKKFGSLIMEQLFIFRPCLVLWNLRKAGGYFHGSHEATQKIQWGSENTIGDGKQNSVPSRA
jgi:hypothetical protein